MSTSLATAMLRLSDNWTLAFGAQMLLGDGRGGDGRRRRARAGCRRPTWRCWPRPRPSSSCPTAFNYDLTVVMIAAVRLWADPRGDAASSARLAVTGFLSPQIGMLLAPLGVPAMPLMLAALFAGQFSRALQDVPAAAPAGPAAAAAAHST